MNKFNTLLILCLLSIVSCKEKSKEPEKETIVEEETIVKKEKVTTSKTYAEISVKEGGKWVGNKYEGGEVFKNVAYLKVPESHTDHSYYIRYEGPGWESNKVGYRLYLDWRNAIDIFGKVTDTMALSKVGQDNFDSYHEMSTWGMDILKAGKSLGIGSIGRYLGDEVLHFKEVDSTIAKINNSEKSSGVSIDYFGWKTAKEKIDLHSQLSIAPDQRYTKHVIQPSQAISGICTGIVKFENVPLVKKVEEGASWGYIATYGTQTLVPDNLGMAIFYKKDAAEIVLDEEHNHLIVFKPSVDEITYYFLGAWEKEKDGIKTKEAFFSYLDDTLIELNANNKI